VLLVVHNQDEVVDGAADEDEDTEDGGAEAGAVPVVVVVGALPGREAVLEEVVVAIAVGSAKDLADEAEASLALRGGLDGGADLLLRGGLDGLALLLELVALGLELLLDLVGVEGAGDLAVGLGDVVDGGLGADAEELVEGRLRVLLVGDDLVADAEDFTIWKRRSVSYAVVALSCVGDSNVPSLLQAAARVVMRPKRPINMVRDFILAYHGAAMGLRRRSV
jgi:hypothetical protein